MNPREIYTKSPFRFPFKKVVGNAEAAEIFDLQGTKAGRPVWQLQRSNTSFFWRSVKVSQWSISSKKSMESMSLVKNLGIWHPKCFRKKSSINVSCLESRLISRGIFKVKVSLLWFCQWSPKASAVYTIRPGIQRCLGISSTCVEVDKKESFRFHYQCIQCIQSNLAANPLSNHFTIFWIFLLLFSNWGNWWSQGDHAHSPSAHSVWAETVNSAMDQVSISFPERSSTIHSISSRTPAKHQLYPLQFNNPNSMQQSFVEEVTIWKSSPKTS